MYQRPLSIAKKIFMALLSAAVGGVVALILAGVILLQSRPDLNVWHETQLDGEYSTDASVSDFKGYLEMEARLFRQLERQVLDQVPQADRGPIKRYHRGSLSDPGRWDRNWNRTFTLEAADPLAGVLLLHGMSDSPYSLHALGSRLNEKGAWVVGLRLPGHGTIPSGLVYLKWEDMAAAIRLAMNDLDNRVGDAPIYLVGYSTGGALAVEYALASLGDKTLPTVDKLVLVSPALGVTRLAALSVWQARLGRWLGLPKLNWNSILPEYNPFKYSSFAINGGEQVYRLTRTLRQRIDAARASGQLERFPPTLAFQSVVDATVSTPAVFTALYNRLDNPAHELVVFDINRQAGVEGLMTTDPLTRIRVSMGDGPPDYDYSLVTNENPSSARVVVQRQSGGSPAGPPETLSQQWPPDVHSLSHVALPFPPDDPLYGISEAVNSPGIALSKITPRGERGVITIPAAEVLRLKWNPFYDYLEQRVLTFFDLHDGTDS